MHFLPLERSAYLSANAAAAASALRRPLEESAYLWPHVLGGLLGGSAVVGVHGLELALDRALPLFAVLVLRRHLLSAALEQQRHALAPGAAAAEGSLRGFRMLSALAGGRKRVLVPLRVRVRESVKEKKSESKRKRERKVKRRAADVERDRKKKRRKNSLSTPTTPATDDAVSYNRPRARRNFMAPSQALACLEVARDTRVPPLEKFIALRRLPR